MIDGPLVAVIVGKGRSGSSLLDTLLDQVDGITATGELWHRWGGRPLESSQCGCGASVGECTVWSPTLAEAREQTARVLGHPVTPDRVFTWEKAVHRWPRVPRLLSVKPAHAVRWPALHGLRIFAAALYRALAARTGARVIIDSSKWPGTVAAVGLLPDLPLRVVQLVRDPRAVAYSWRRVQDLVPGDSAMPRFGAAFSAVSWIVRNEVARKVRERAGEDAMLLTYERLSQRPSDELSRVLKLLGIDAPPPVREDGNATLRPNHTVGGNPSRFRLGTVQVQQDAEWRTSLSRWDRAVVTSLTRPWLAQYGYQEGS